MPKPHQADKAPAPSGQPSQGVEPGRWGLPLGPSGSASSPWLHGGRLSLGPAPMLHGGVLECSRSHHLLCRHAPSGQPRVWWAPVSRGYLPSASGLMVLLLSGPVKLSVRRLGSPPSRFNAYPGASVRHALVSLSAGVTGHGRGACAGQGECAWARRTFLVRRLMRRSSIAARFAAAL